MPRLIRVFAGHTLTLLVLSCRGTYLTGNDYPMNPKTSDTRKNCCNYPKTGSIVSLQSNGFKNADGIANSVDPGKTAPLGYISDL